MTCICFQYLCRVLLLEGEACLYLFCNSFVFSQAFQTPTAAVKMVWAACAQLKLSAQRLQKEGNLLCCTLIFILALLSVTGHSFLPEALSSIYHDFSHEMVAFAGTGAAQYHCRVVSHCQLPKWLWLALCLHCSLSVIAVLKYEPPQHSPFWDEGSMQLT